MQQGQQRQHHATTTTTTTATLCLLPTHKTVSDPQPSEQGAGRREQGAGAGDAFISCGTLFLCGAAQGKQREHIQPATPPLEHRRTYHARVREREK